METGRCMGWMQSRVSLKNFLRGMETSLDDRSQERDAASKTSLEGWKHGQVLRYAVARGASKTSLEGWKHRSPSAKWS